jgi:hypothetical protein
MRRYHQEMWQLANVRRQEEGRFGEAVMVIRDC